MSALRYAAAVFPLAFLCSTTALAQKPAPVSSLVKQVNIPFEQFTLPNGLRVIVHTDRMALVRRTSPRGKRASRICSNI
jgi:zinc protease